MEHRPFVPGEEQEILDLFAIAFRRELSHTYWKWRFEEAPAGRGVIMMARDNARLAAHYAVTPAVLSIDGRDVQCCLSGTTMTHPDYRGGGLFPALAEATYAEAARRGIHLVWGFGNPKSHRVLVRDLHWTDIWEIPTFRLPLSLAHTAELRSDVETCTGPLVGFDELWSVMRHRYRVVAARDAATIEWRYRRNPSEQYRIVQRVVDGKLSGYAVLKRFQTELHIVDLLARDTETGVQLVHAAIGHARTEGLNAVSLWLGVHHPLHHELERMGFQNELPITYFGARIINSAVPETPIMNYRDWYLTMGDSDVY